MFACIAAMPSTVDTITFETDN